MVVAVGRDQREAKRLVERSDGHVERRGVEDGARLRVGERIEPEQGQGEGALFGAHARRARAPARPSRPFRRDPVEDRRGGGLERRPAAEVLEGAVRGARRHDDERLHDASAASSSGRALPRQEQAREGLARDGRGGSSAPGRRVTKSSMTTPTVASWT